MANAIDEDESRMSELKRFWHAVTAMRAAQKLEWDALPANFRLWKRAREKQAVSRLEVQVDQLADDLRRRYGLKGGDEEEQARKDESECE
jgi:hypothetical protein